MSEQNNTEIKKDSLLLEDRRQDQLRLTYQESQFRKTQHIGKLKLALPIATALIAIIVFIWISTGGQPIEVEPAPTNPVAAALMNEIKNPRFETQDQKGQPYTLLAEKAQRDADNQDLVNLTKPSGDVRLQSGRWLAINADKGTVNQKTQMLNLIDNVQIFDDQGYTLQASKMDVDMQAERVIAPVPISGQGPAGTLQGASLDLSMETGLLVIQGPAQMTLFNQEGLNNWP